MVHEWPDREIQRLYFAAIWQQKQKLSVRNGIMQAGYFLPVATLTKQRLIGYWN